MIAVPLAGPNGGWSRIAEVLFASGAGREEMRLPGCDKIKKACVEQFYFNDGILLSFRMNFSDYFCINSCIGKSFIPFVLS